MAIRAAYSETSEKSMRELNGETNQVLIVAYVLFIIFKSDTVTNTNY